MNPMLEPDYAPNGTDATGLAALLKQPGIKNKILEALAALPPAAQLDFQRQHGAVSGETSVLLDALRYVGSYAKNPNASQSTEPGIRRHDPPSLAVRG